MSNDLDSARDRVRSAAGAVQQRASDRLSHMLWAFLLRGLLAGLLGIRALIWPTTRIAILARRERTKNRRRSGVAMNTHGDTHTDRTHLVGVAAGFALVFSLACSTAYYSAWEMLGKEKRDLLRSNVEEVRDDQQKAADQFESALDRMRQLYDVDAGELEDAYDKLAADYDKSKDRAGDLSDQIDTVDSIANDLFKEWEGEIGEISSPDLKAKSRQKLEESKASYARLESSLQKSEASMEPVLTKLHDNVLYLKHNLNAAVVGGLSVEVSNIEADISTLIADMEASIAEADRFLQTLPE